MRARAFPRWVRTLRHLRADQLVDQLRHAVRGPVAPVRLGGTIDLAECNVPVPFLAAPAHAQGDGQRVRLLRREVEFGERVDWEEAGEGPLWAFHLHQFDWLRQPQFAPDRRAALMLDWIERHPRGIGWSPHPTCFRILSWGKLLATRGALELDTGQRQRIIASLGDQAQTLARNPEVRLQANHLFSNWLGVVFAGIACRGAAADAWLAHAADLREQVELQIGADGSHVERSPMYHSLLLENVLDLLNLSRGVPGRAPAGLDAHLEAAAARMRGALGVWTHPDGEIALLSDSAFGIAHPPNRLHAYADALGVAARDPETSGWLPLAGSLRLEASPFSLLASLCGPQPAFQPGHAHCDALSFELCVDNERVVTDSGVSEYIPGPLRAFSRSTLAHATLEIDAVDQAELWASHRIGGRPRVRVETVEPPQRGAARCVGWATRDTEHRRAFAVTEEGVEIVDSIEGASRPVVLSLPLGPGLEPELTLEANGTGVARVPLQSGRVLRITLPRGPAWRVDRVAYFPEFGQRLDRACLLGRADVFREGTWCFELEP